MHALRQDQLARGAAQRSQDLARIADFLVKTTHAATEDHIDANALTPVGGLAIAQKDGELDELPRRDREAWLRNIRN